MYRLERCGVRVDYMHTYKSICVYALYMHKYKSICVYALYIHTYKSICMYALCMHTYKSICMYALYMHTYKSICMYICIHWSAVASASRSARMRSSVPCFKRAAAAASASSCQSLPLYCVTALVLHYQSCACVSAPLPPALAPPAVVAASRCCFTALLI